MTDTTAQPPTLSDLQHEACMLEGMIEGIDVLNDASGLGYTTHDIVERRASNAMRPMIEATIKAARELTNRLGILEGLERKAVRMKETAE